MDWLNQLEIDVDRLEHFEQLEDTDLVEEYKELIVSHARELFKEKKSK